MGSTRKSPVDTTNIWRSAEQVIYQDVNQAGVEVDKTRFRLTDAVEKLKKGPSDSEKSHDPPTKYVMSIRANNTVQPDKRKFHFKIEIVGSQNEKPTVTVGFCSKLAYLSALPGGKYAHALTWGYHEGSGDKYAQNHSGKKFSGRFGIRDTVGTVGYGIDLSKGPGYWVIYFTGNGKHLGTAFKDVKGQLFPVVRIEAKDTKVTVRVTFGHDGKNPFKYAKVNHT